MAYGLLKHILKAGKAGLTGRQKAMVGTVAAGSSAYALNKALGAGVTENRDKLNNQFQDFENQQNEITSSSGIDWDDENMIKVHDYFEKINKKYYDMDTSELPFMMAQQVYDYNNKDVEASKKMLKHLNDTLEAHPDFDKYRGGDYWSYWDDEFNKIKKRVGKEQ